MNDSEIIKALATSSDPNNLNCQPTTKLCKEALDLINRQQAEIERLTAIVETAIESTELSADFFGKKAVREFAEKLKTEMAGLEVKSPNITYKCGMEDVLYYRMPKIIDRLAEEMGCNDG